MPTNSKPRVSVCMLAYNHAPWIEQAIRSVLDQQVDFGVEVVVGEDCSPDNTREIVRAMAAADDRVRLLAHPSNIGAPRNYLTTVAACRGEYIAFCEGDDYWHRLDKLRLQVPLLDADPSMSLVCSDFDTLWDGTGRRMTECNRRARRVPSELPDLCHVLRGTPTSGIQTCTVVARASMLREAIATDPEFTNVRMDPAGDTPLWLALAVRGRIGYVPQSLATYRRIAESATQSNSSAKVLRISIGMKEQMLRLIDDYHLPQTERQRHLHDIALRQLKLAYFEQDRTLAQRARTAIGRLGPVEWLHYWGAQQSWRRRAVQPLLAVLSRDLIPTSR